MKFYKYETIITKNNFSHQSVQFFFEVVKFRLNDYKIFINNYDMILSIGTIDPTPQHDERHISNLTIPKQMMLTKDNAYNLYLQTIFKD
jgi:hypothetical protein